MTRSNSLISSRSPWAIETGVAINLVATKNSATILAACAPFIAVTQAAFDELSNGSARDKRDADVLISHAKNGLLNIVDLNDSALDIFESLISGSSLTTLSDSEAATISYAISHGGVAFIDGAKSRDLCQTKYPNLIMGETFDILLHERVREKLSNYDILSAISNAQRHANIKIPPDYRAMVLSLQMTN